MVAQRVGGRRERRSAGGPADHWSPASRPPFGGPAQTNMRRPGDPAAQRAAARRPSRPAGGPGERRSQPGRSADDSASWRAAGEKISRSPVVGQQTATRRPGRAAQTNMRRPSRPRWPGSPADRQSAAPAAQEPNMLRPHGPAVQHAAPGRPSSPACSGPPVRRMI